MTRHSAPTAPSRLIRDTLLVVGTFARIHQLLDVRTGETHEHDVRQYVPNGTFPHSRVDQRNTLPGMARFPFARCLRFGR